MSVPPRRWLDSEIPAELREALASAELDRAPDAQLARLSAQLEHTLGPGWTQGAGNAESSAIGAPAAVSGGLGWGGTLALAGALLAGLGAVWFGTRSSQPTRAVRAIPTIAAAHADVTASPMLPAPVQHAALEPARANQHEPAARAAAAPPAKRSAVRPAAQSGGLVEELKQLEAIRKRVPSQPARALREIAQHARRFPQGALGPERELLRIEALQRAGRAQEAERAAERALRDGAHPYAAQIRQLLAGQR